MAQFSSYSSHLSGADFPTDELQSIAIKLISRSRNSSITARDLVISYIREIKTHASEIEIEIGVVITKFSYFLCNMMTEFNQNSATYNRVLGDDRMILATTKVLTSTWSDVIRGMLENRIIRSVMFDKQERMEELFEGVKPRVRRELQIHQHFIQSRVRETKQYELLPDFSSRLIEYNNQQKKSHSPLVKLKTEARVLSKLLNRNIAILDADKEPILTISSHDIRDSIELVYNPPCHEYPEGHFDAHVRGKVVKVPSNDYDDCDRLFSATNIATFDTDAKYIYKSRQDVEQYIDEHPSDAGRLLLSNACAYQLKTWTCLSTVRYGSSNKTIEPM